MRLALSNALIGQKSRKIWSPAVFCGREVGIYMVFWVFSDIRYVLWGCVRCVRMVVSTRARPSSPTRKMSASGPLGRNIACRVTACVTRRRSRVDIARTRPPPHRVLFTFCVFLTARDHAVWRRASNVARARWRSAREWQRSDPFRAADAIRRRDDARRWTRGRRVEREIELDVA